MSSFCQDRDLLSIEPGAFVGGGFPSQRLVAGSDGVLSGTTFTSAGSDFVSAGVAPAMVVCVYTTTPSEGSAYEIISVDSATTLTVSVLRADTSADAVSPPSGSGLSFCIETFAVQIEAVSNTLAEKLRQITEVAGIDSADFADSTQLRLATAVGVLSTIFVTRAQNATDSDANWVKAEHYRDEFRTRQLQLRLTVDADGNGRAEQTRTLGNMTLRRV